ncbi:hypothetical protein LJC26_00090 [Desulfovibrio sp. OttesenSCG-928-O18]|nr:hypothetical protein [Desulfovibrio sp. OttesenSCG-928-O18]
MKQPATARIAAFLFSSGKFPALLLALLLNGLLLPLPGHAAGSPKIVVTQAGALPKSGRVVIRSGLAWLDESAPAFQRLAADFSRELTARGLTMVAVAPSALEAMPKTPLPTSPKTQAPPLPSRPQAKGNASGDLEAEGKALELGRSGKLPKLTLRGYATPSKDADLPQSVKSVAPPDVTKALYARSQEVGHPVVNSFAIPGRMPKELAADAEIADYAVIIRFASVRAWAAAPDGSHFGPPGVLVAASSIRGSGSLGFGPPASPSASGQSTYGTPGGYVRGYEGASPNDFWHRDNDFYQRDYMFKHGPQPNYATPPSGLSPSRDVPPGAAPLPGRGHGPSIAGWQLLLLDAYDLAPMRTGKKPKHIWQASVRRPEDEKKLADALPEMARAVFAEQR